MNPGCQLNFFEDYGKLSICFRALAGMGHKGYGLNYRLNIFFKFSRILSHNN